MLIFSALTCSIVTFLMCVLHLLLSIGAPIGEYVLGGQNKVIPINKRWINVILTFIFLFVGVLYLGKAILFQFSEIPSKVIMIAYSLFLAYAIIGNIFFTKSRKEKAMMIPASVIGFISSLSTLLLSW